MSFSLAPANTPRFTLPDNELLVEGARTNWVRNARALGLAVGTPGTFPTHWVAQNPGPGLQRQVVGFGTEDGLPYIDLRLFGTTTAPNSTWRIDFEPVNVVAAAQGQVWTSSAFVRRIAGAFPTPGSAVLFVQEFSSAGGQINQSGTSFVTATNAPLASQRFSHTRTLTQAATAFVAITVFFNVDTPGTVVDVTLRIGAPQLEQGPFASSPILPAPGTITASSRGDDGLSVLLTDVLVPASGACTLLLAGRLGQAAAAGVTQMLAQIDDGTDANRVLVYCAPGTASLRMRAVLAGVAGPEVTLGTVVPGEIWRLVASLDGGGRLAASLNGAAPLAVTGGPTAGLVAALVGTSRAGEALFGTLRHVQVIPAPTQDAALPALAATMP